MFRIEINTQTDTVDYYQHIIDPISGIIESHSITFKELIDKINNHDCSK